MNETVDLREYIFPILSVLTDGDNIRMDGRKFLGTGFFVSRKGDAVTAAHVIPQNVDQGRRLVAVVLVDDKETICWINQAATFPHVDFALVKVNLAKTKFFPVSQERLEMGTDIRIIGISEHETAEAGKKQMRLLKGHIVTFVGHKLELSFAVPAGMSGAPVMIGGEVVGYATGRVRSEEIEDSSEEIEEINSRHERIVITEIRRVTFYGVAYSIGPIMDSPTTIFSGDRTLRQFIADQNS